jgi:hypothetical protein
LLLREAQGFGSAQAVQAWTPGELSPGQAPRAAAPLLKKLDESVILEEYARLEAYLGSRHRRGSLRNRRDLGVDNFSSSVYNRAWRNICWS